MIDYIIPVIIYSLPDVDYILMRIREAAQIIFPLLVVLALIGMLNENNNAVTWYLPPCLFFPESRMKPREKLNFYFHAILYI